MKMIRIAISIFCHRNSSRDTETVEKTRGGTRCYKSTGILLFSTFTRDRSNILSQVQAEAVQLPGECAQQQEAFFAIGNLRNCMVESPALNLHELFIRRRKKKKKKVGRDKKGRERFKHFEDHLPLSLILCFTESDSGYCPNKKCSPVRMPPAESRLLLASHNLGQHY